MDQGQYDPLTSNSQLMAGDLLDKSSDHPTGLSLSDQADMLNAGLDQRGMYTSNPHYDRDPVNRFPIELVEGIFLLSSKGTWQNRSESLAHSAVPLSHVSRRWRKITLNLPRLWAYINLDETTLSGIFAFVLRSQAVPLHIYLANLDLSKLAFLDFIAHRIQELYFYDDPDLVIWEYEEFDAFSDLHLPALEECILVPGLDRADFVWPAFLQGNIQSLKKLELHGIQDEAMPEMARFPSLTHLTINIGEIRLPAICSLLSECPLLQEVKLSDAWADTLSYEPASDYRTVKLDQLNVLTITSTDGLEEMLVKFFSVVEFNPLAAVHLSIDGFSFDEPAEAEELFSTELSQFNALQSTTTLYIMRDDEQMAATIVGVAGRTLPAIHLQMCAEDSLLRDTLDMFPLAQITELWIGPYIASDTVYLVDLSELSRKMVVQVLKRLPGLRILAFHSDYMRLFSLALAPQANPPASLLCPGLEVLRICWDRDDEAIPTARDLSAFVDKLSRTRPTVRVFAGTKEISPNSISSCANARSRMPTMSFDTVGPDGYRWDWETCFGS